MIDLIINDHTYQIPDKWGEVKLGQWITMARYADALDHIRILSIFTDLDYDVLANMPCDQIKTELIPEMGFLSDPIDFMNRPRPTKITIGGKELEPIADPGRERFGQKLFMQQMVDGAIAGGGDHWDLVAPTIACYYAPFLHPDNKWDDRHVKSLYPLIFEMPVIEAYPEAVFFLNGYIKLGKSKPIN